MTTTGADQFADAPFIPLGTSSAYTPNAGYGTEVGEPTAWGGKTAWWRYTAETAQFVYVDVLHSLGGDVQSTTYRAFVDNPDFTDLFPVSAPAPNAQGGFNAAAGGTYWIRLDSDGADVSYVLSIGADVYDFHTETRTLTAPRTDGTTEVREDYFTGTGYVSGPGEATSIAILEDNVQGGGGETAVMHVEDYANETIAQYPTYAGLDWYEFAGSEDDHPVITYAVEVGEPDPVAAPDGFELIAATIKVAIWSTAGPDLVADGSGEVLQVRTSGAFDGLTPAYYLDDAGMPQGDVPSGLVGVPHSFTPGFGDSTTETYYNDGSLVFDFLPNLTGIPGSYPVGDWFVGVVTLEFLYRSEDPHPYEPPPPPIVVAVRRRLRNYPTDVGRNYPPDRFNRNAARQP